MTTQSSGMTGAGVTPPEGFSSGVFCSIVLSVLGVLGAMAVTLLDSEGGERSKWYK